MTSKDMSSLNDVYRILSEPNSPSQTSYILQFLWRDLTNSYDIVGPYFTSSDSVDGKFVLSCVMETVKLFQIHGLNTSLLVCDGNVANLTAIKVTHGYSGAYSVLPDAAEDVFEVKPWMINPFNPPSVIYWVICPSHQVKSSTNVLVFISIFNAQLKNMVTFLLKERWHEAFQTWQTLQCLWMGCHHCHVPM